MDHRTKFHSFLAFILAVLLTGCATGTIETTASGTTTASAQTTTAASGTTAAPEQVTVVAMKGPTGMGILPYVEAHKAEGFLDFRIETLPETVVVGLGKEEIDVAAIPANLAATLFQKMEGELQVAAVIVKNVLYIAENGDSIETVADLEGRTLYSTGRGATPEAALTLLLEGASLEIGRDVQVEYSAEATEVASRLLAKPGSVALLQEPFLTAVERQNEGIRVRLDLDELWQDQFGSDAAIVTGVLVARKDFLEDNQAWFDGFLNEYEDSVAKVIEDPAEGARLIGAYGIIDVATAEAAIPRSGLSFIRGPQMRRDLEGYLTKLHGYDPKLIGGALPGDAFYYLGD